ncbi:MAG TPA: lysylphosphatidylglycerol synthase transmembrane domain-containing protein [Candidatus Limnocylindrales bacterium]|nr:lysylphosphatidylglycerol synthase transmembrane domain-containing protein [Candidatus Limnocylindrales bacterium]
MSDGAGAQSKPVRLSRRKIVLRLLVLIGLLTIVFAGILPRIVDYDDVWAALSRLTPVQLAALAIATAVGYVASATPCKVLIRRLSWPHAVGADLAARAVASTIPGPTDVATRFMLFRQWRVPAEIASAAIVFAAFFETLSSLVLPAIATVGVVLAGNTTRPGVLSLSVIGLAILAAGTLLLIAIVRSVSLALRLGHALDTFARRVWPLFRKEPPEGIVQAVVDLRLEATNLLSRRGLLAFVTAVGAKLAWFLVLETALWAVGVSWAVVPPSTVLVAMALVGIVAMIPITPGAIGVTEIAYVALLTAVAGSGVADEITAAVLLLRIAQWLLVIPIGWISLVVIRGNHWRELATEVPEPPHADLGAAATP